MKMKNNEILKTVVLRNLKNPVKLSHKIADIIRMRSVIIAEAIRSVG